MKELAAVHLRQARMFVRSGDPNRAIELFEKARLLSNDDNKLHEVVLLELADAYKAVGQPDRARDCLEQLEVYDAEAEQTPSDAAPEERPPVQPRFMQMMLILTILVCVGVATALAVLWRVFTHRPPAPIEQIVVPARASPATTRTTGPSTLFP